MSAQPQLPRMSQAVERELARRLDLARAENRPAEVEIAGNRYSLVLVDEDIQTTDDPGASYDPAKAMAALEAGAGAFKGMNVEAFLAEIYEARDQDTPGHSF